MVSRFRVTRHLSSKIAKNLGFNKTDRTMVREIGHSSKTITDKKLKFCHLKVDLILGKLQLFSPLSKTKYVANGRKPELRSALLQKPGDFFPPKIPL